MAERSMTFALRVMKMAEYLPRTPAAQNTARQIVRSACSIAANYRSAQRAKSHADFRNKITIVLEEADETAFWIELAERAGFLPAAQLQELKGEAEALVRIFAAMRRTSRQAG